MVPRVPAGEITPQKLIALGEVGKKYGLYTKITGGQRIDLFGAEKGDLPSIWEELVDAGFESGTSHASPCAPMSKLAVHGRPATLRPC